jgi:hypothetical protein
MSENKQTKKQLSKIKRAEATKLIQKFVEDKSIENELIFLRFCVRNRLNVGYCPNCSIPVQAGRHMHCATCSKENKKKALKKFYSK